MARKLERLRLAIVAERVKLLLLDGRTEQAVRFARSAGIPQSCAHMLPKRGVTTRDEWRAVAWFRIAVSEGRMQEALSVGKHWRNFCSARGAVRSLDPLGSAARAGAVRECRCARRAAHACARPSGMPPQAGRSAASSTRVRSFAPCSRAPMRPTWMCCIRPMHSPRSCWRPSTSRRRGNPRCTPSLTARRRKGYTANSASRSARSSLWSVPACAIAKWR